MSQAIDYKSPSVLTAEGPVRGGVLRWWMLALVAVIALGVFANSVVNGFALDDAGIIENNPAVTQLQWAEIWYSNYWPSPEGAPDVLYRPLTIWSYLANEAITPGKAWPFHAVNIVLHAFVSVLVTALAFRLIRNAAVAVVTGILFAVHPIHTEVVANTVGRAELLAAMWSAIVLLLFLPKTPLLEKPPEKRGVWHGWLVAVCFFAGALCKETPLALLPAVVFLDIWRWSWWDKSHRPTLIGWLATQGWRYYVPMAIFAGIYLGMRVHAVGLMAAANTCHPIVNPLVTSGIAERIVTPFALIAKYIGLIFWPRTLSADYSYPSIVPSANVFAPMTLMGVMLVIAGITTVFGRWRSWTAAPMLVGMLAISYLLVANILRIGTIFGERLFYWPSAFALMLVSVALVRGWNAVAILPTRQTLRSMGVTAVAAACVAMGIRTVTRNTVWKDNVNLAISTALDNPESAKACFWAGSVLMTQTDKPEWEAAGLELVKIALVKREDYGLPQWELAKYYERQQQFGESFAWLCRSARWRSGTFEVRMSLQAVKEVLKVRRPSEYMPVIERMLSENPGDASGYLALGMAQHAAGKFADAEKSLGKALEMDRHFLEASFELGLVKLDAGDTETAIKFLKGYNIIVSTNPEARVQLARAFMKVDWEKDPAAMVEAQYNLEKASKMVLAGPRVREAQTEFNRMKADLDVRLKAKMEREGTLRADAGEVGVK